MPENSQKTRPGSQDQTRAGRQAAKFAPKIQAFLLFRTVARQTKNRPKWPFLVFFGLAWYLVKFFNGVNLALTAFFLAWPVLDMGKKKAPETGAFFRGGLCSIV